MENEFILESFADFNITELHSSAKSGICARKRSLGTVGNEIPKKINWCHLHGVVWVLLRAVNMQ